MTVFHLVSEKVNYRICAEIVVRTATMLMEMKKKEEHDSLRRSINWTALSFFAQLKR